MSSKEIVESILTIVVVGIAAIFGVSVMDHGYKFKADGDNITLDHDNT